MSSDLERGLEKQKQRYHMLRAWYQRAGDAERSVEDFFRIAEDLGLVRDEAEAALQYLEGESLLERMSQGQSVLITDKGRLEIERSLTHPNESTEHFSALTIHAQTPASRSGTGNLESGALQNTAQDSAEISQLIHALQQTTSALPPEQRQEANEYLEDLQAEVGSPSPKQSKLKATLIALWYTGEAFVPFTAQVCELAAELGIHLPTAVSKGS